jgi:two-component system sensor histidine kinase AgrC
MFFSITLINWLYLSFAYIETVVFFAIMIPYCVLFFKDRIFVKILIPVILNVIYLVLSFGINYIFSAIISCDYNYLMIESSQYRYMYVLMSNLIFVIYNLFKNSLSHIHKQEILITLVIPLLSIAVGLLTFLLSSNADMSDFDRIVLGAVSIIILSFTFINFYLIKSLSIILWKMKIFCLIKKKSCIMFK